MSHSQLYPLLTSLVTASGSPASLLVGEDCFLKTRITWLFLLIVRLEVRACDRRGCVIHPCELLSSCVKYIVCEFLLFSGYCNSCYICRLHWYCTVIIHAEAAGTVVSGFLIPIANCTLQSLVWFQYWNGGVSCESDVAHHMRLCHSNTVITYTIDCSVQCAIWTKISEKAVNEWLEHAGVNQLLPILTYDPTQANVGSGGALWRAAANSLSVEAVFISVVAVRSSNRRGCCVDEVQSSICTYSILRCNHRDVVSLRSVLSCTLSV